MQTHIRGYKLIEKIGHGGFGEIYRAEQRTVNREVAIKVILPEYANDADFIARFHTEAELIGRIEHPFIVPLYDYWHDDNGACLVMRWMRGGSLTERIKQLPSRELVLRWIEQIAGALHAAHEQGVIHRDLKPDNILLDDRQNAYLADFGIAKDLTIAPNAQTQSPFTPHYAAPEQFGGGTFTSATDIYAFGIVIYELLHGKPPYEGTLMQLIQSHLNDPLPDLHHQHTSIPAAVDEILAQATAKNPEERYQDSLTLFEKLQAAFDTPLPVQPPTIQVDNPFFHRGPIRDSTYFFGRDNETRQLLNLLHTGQSVSIIGQRRIGKTSLLHHILDPDILSEHGINPQQHILIYIDCGSLITLNQHDIYRLLLEEIEDRLDDMGVHDVEFKALQTDGDLSYRDFERALRRFFRAGWRLGLALDEFELLSRNEHLDSTFFTGLRALAMRHPLTYLSASKQPLLDLTYADESTLSSPFFNIFATIQLGRFSQDDARIMLVTLSQQAGQPLPNTVIEQLYILSGGMPLFLQIGAYRALEQLREQGTIDSNLLQQQLDNKIRSHLEYYWRSLSLDNQRMMLTLPLATGRDRDRLQHLQKQALLIAEDDNSYRHVSPLLTAFINKQPVPDIHHAGSMVIDEIRHEVVCYGRAIDVTPLQYDLLRLFITHADETITTEAMENALWEDDYIDDPERLKSVIKGLRRALGDYADHIENVRGVGYRWQSTL